MTEKEEILFHSSSEESDDSASPPPPPPPDPGGAATVPRFTEETTDEEDEVSNKVAEDEDDKVLSSKFKEYEQALLKLTREEKLKQGKDPDKVQVAPLKRKREKAELPTRQRLTYDAEQAIGNGVPCGSFGMTILDYKRPRWSGKPERLHWASIFQNGKEKKRKEFDIEAEHVVFGRAPSADIRVSHISISRHHCVIQFSARGEIYLMDLGSTHGTMFKGQRLTPFNYVRIQICDEIYMGRYERAIVLMAASNPLIADDPDYDLCWDWYAGFCRRDQECRFRHSAPKHPQFQAPRGRIESRSARISAREHFKNRFYDTCTSAEQKRDFVATSGTRETQHGPSHHQKRKIQRESSIARSTSVRYSSRERERDSWRRRDR